MTQDSTGESAATMLVALAKAEADLFHWGECCFATISVSEHMETYALRSRGFRSWLGKRFYEEHQRAASGENLTSAIQTLEGIARYEGTERRVGVRIQSDCGKIYLDLANDDWQVVEISADGWRIIESRVCPVRFRRPHGMLALPKPEPGGKISHLRPFLNVSGDDGFVLTLGWLIGALHPFGPYPLLIFHGEQGSAKTTSARLLRALVDPNLAPVRSEPREPRDLMISANNGWICAFDNLSNLPPWLSDALCRLSTGGGFGTRALYTDDEEMIFEAKRPAILTGIEELAVRGDLLDRALIVDLPRIPEEHYQSEEQFWMKFENEKPRLLGALLTAVSAALANQSKVSLDRLPRMADFAKWVSAAEPALGWERGTFLRAYAANRKAANELALETPVAEVIRKLALPWTGTASELLANLETYVNDRTQRSRSWPATPRQLSNTLRRLAPNLRQVGVFVEFGAREPGTGRRLITISDNESISSSQASQSSREPQAQPTQNPIDSERPGKSDERDDEIPSFRVEGEL